MIRIPLRARPEGHDGPSTAEAVLELEWCEERDGSASIGLRLASPYGGAHVLLDARAARVVALELLTLTAAVRWP